MTLDLGLDAFEDAHCGRVVVDAAGGAESGDDDGRGGDQIVGECVVQVALWGVLGSGVL